MHRYTVQGWGTGELLVAGGVVVAHEIDWHGRKRPARPDRHELVGVGVAVDRPRASASGGSRGAAATVGPASPGGDARPPGVTLAAGKARLRAGSVPDFRTAAHTGVAGDLAGRRDDAGNVPEVDERDRALAELVADRVRAHLAGRATSYADVPLDLSWCTGFQRALADALREVPWGEIVSYGELAALAGRPGAARAAGTFCAQNRFALMLPCQRVVSVTGIGGYGASGIRLKRTLLRLEGIEL